MKSFSCFRRQQAGSIACPVLTCWTWRDLERIGCLSGVDTTSVIWAARRTQDPHHGDGRVFSAQRRSQGLIIANSVRELVTAVSSGLDRSVFAGFHGDTNRAGLESTRKVVMQALYNCRAAESRCPGSAPSSLFHDAIASAILALLTMYVHSTNEFCNPWGEKLQTRKSFPAASRSTTEGFFCWALFVVAGKAGKCLVDMITSIRRGCKAGHRVHPVHRSPRASARHSNKEPTTVPGFATSSSRLSTPPSDFSVLWSARVLNHGPNNRPSEFARTAERLKFSSLTEMATLFCQCACLCALALVVFEGALPGHNGLSAGISHSTSDCRCAQCFWLH